MERPVWITAFLDLPADRFDQGVEFWRAVTGDAVSEPRGAHGDHGDHGHLVMASPGGLGFCLVTRPAAERPPAQDWADGARSLVDQVCIDIPARQFDAETAFWAALIGVAPVAGSLPEFVRVVDPALPLRLLLQRLGEDEGRTRAHLDLACAGRESETRRHLRLGAIRRDIRDHWTVLTDPVGSPYCITDRHPDR